MNIVSMTKKEINEIKKQFKPSANVVNRICGCYVDGEKQVKLWFKDAFYSLPEDEAFKYFAIFKQSLSGMLGKNMINMEFNSEEEAEGGKQEMLLKLKETKLQDDALLEEFFNKIIDSYDYAENYYIILTYGVYDVPGRTTDGLSLEDASDNVYDFILCSLCPVNLSKAALGYNPDKNIFEERLRDWVVEAPMNGFLFPAFVDRAQDVHETLFYTKNAENLQPAFIENVLGAASIPMTATTQKESFKTIIEETLGDDCDYETVKNIHYNIGDLLDKQEDKAEPLVITKSEMKQILEESGLDDNKLEVFESKYENIAGKDTTFIAGNIVDTKKVKIDTANIQISVKPEYMNLIETKLIDGKYSIVITISDQVEINGIPVRN